MVVQVVVEQEQQVVEAIQDREDSQAALVVLFQIL
jgi:hypothetical protein